MSCLTQRARAYLDAGGFTVRRSEPHFLEMERIATPGKPGERILLWTQDRTSAQLDEPVPAEQTEHEARESILLESFAHEMRAAPGAAGFFLVDRRLGLSQRFMTQAKNLLGEKGGIRAPVEFFDAAYKIDGAEGRRVRSALGDLLDKAGKTRRVAQPFHIRHGLGQPAQYGGDDLVQFLVNAIAEPSQGPKLHIIEGGAGSGKTIAFNALVMSLHREFIQAKRARQERRRPIVFLPSHLRNSQVGYVNDVIAAVAQTDAAEAVEADQFRWLLLNGHSLWMFDGLDEFYAGSSDFFTFIDEALSAPGSKAQFIICTRDSLLSSSEALRSFIDRGRANGRDIEIFEPAPWNADAWREIARLELEGGPAAGAELERICEFVSALKSSSHLGKLAQLPFYCSVLLERFLTHGALPENEFDALEFLVNRMVDREQSKNIFRWQDFVDLDVLTDVVEQEVANRSLPRPSDFNPRELIQQLLDDEGREILLELIGSIAHMQRRTAGGPESGSGLSVDDIGDLSGLSNVPFNLNADVVHRLRTVIVQFAFFGPARKAGRVDFAHPILSDYFAARHAVAILRRELCGGQGIAASGGVRGEDLDAIGRSLTKAIGTAELVPDSLFCRFLAHEIRRDAKLSQRFQALREHGDDGRQRSVGALQLLS